MAITLKSSILTGRHAFSFVYHTYLCRPHTSGAEVRYHSLVIPKRRRQNIASYLQKPIGEGCRGIIKITYLPSAGTRDSYYATGYPALPRQPAPVVGRSAASARVASERRLFKFPAEEGASGSLILIVNRVTRNAALRPSSLNSAY